MTLLLLVPILCFLLLFGVLYSAPSVEGKFTRLRQSLSTTILLTGVFLVFITETLSYGHHISFKGILSAWSLLAVLLLLLFIYKRLSLSVYKEICSTTLQFIRRFPILVVIPVILAFSGFLALVYPPNNYDSLTYHMARVGHWINNHSISHYPTHILRQIIFPPFAEWSIMHVQLLSGTDRFANLIQTLFFAGCILQVSLLLKSFGATTKQQVFGSLFTATIPMAVIQSNTTQNDVVVAYFILTFVYYTIEIVKSPSLNKLVLAGIAIGLAMLTKGTAYVFCLLFCGWYFIILLRQYNKSSGAILLKALRFGIIAIIALLLNYGHFYRNSFLTGSIIGGGDNVLVNEEHHLKPLAFVAIKNFMNHMPVSHEMKADLTDFAKRHDVDINDTKYTLNDIKWMANGFSFHEDYAQNFLHTLFIVGALFIFFFSRKLYTEKISIYTLFVFTCVGTVAIYCFVFKWQPWSNRLETAMFMLFCPLLAFTFSGFPKVLRTIVLIPFFAFTAAGLLKSSRHPIFPVKNSIFKKPYSYFIYDGGFPDCKKFMDTSSAKSFGLYIGEDMPDYVYYKMLFESKNPNRPMKHVFVSNASRRYLTNFVPEIMISAADTHNDKLLMNGRLFVREKICETGRPVIFRRVDDQ